MILQNAIRTPDGTLLVSAYRHDYVVHKDANGEQYMIDGGAEYFRASSHHKNPPEINHVTTDMPFARQREFLVWGSRGINGDQPLTHIKLKDMDTSHIEAVLKTQNISPERRAIMEEELCGRS